MATATATAWEAVAAGSSGGVETGGGCGGLVEEWEWEGRGEES